MTRSVSISAPRFAVGDRVKRRRKSCPTLDGDWVVVTVTPDKKLAKYHEYKLTNGGPGHLAEFECELESAWTRSVEVRVLSDARQQVLDRAEERSRDGCIRRVREELGL